ncbi:MAG: hypothetical protein KJZ69_03995 [Phycisphaerales bacterium]|nr:hypothetical protein [Phycisphaerales bacterium]
MTSLTRKLLPFGSGCVLALAACLSLTGCKEEEPPPPPPPPPPPGPVTVDPNSVAEYLTLDPKVSLRNAQPMECSEEEVRAILEFMSAFAAGDAEALRSRMDGTARKSLDKLISTGQWQEETAKIIEVDLLDRKSMPSGGGVVSFNVIMPRAGRVQQDWLVTMRGDMFTFSAFAVPPESKQAEDAAKAAQEAASGAPGGEPAPEDDRDRNRDPRRRVPQPTDPTAPPGKQPTQP